MPGSAANLEAYKGLEKETKVTLPIGQPSSLGRVGWVSRRDTNSMRQEMEKFMLCGGRESVVEEQFQLCQTPEASGCHRDGARG